MLTSSTTIGAYLHGRGEIAGYLAKHKIRLDERATHDTSNGLRKKADAYQ
jgi:hypothetical protein